MNASITQTFASCCGIYKAIMSSSELDLNTGAITIGIKPARNPLCLKR
jgi:hypothetical protein